MPKSKIVYLCVHCDKEFGAEEEAKKHESECSDNPVFRTRIAVDIKVDKNLMYCNNECPSLIPCISNGRRCTIFGELKGHGMKKVCEKVWSQYSRHANCVDAQSTWMEANNRRYY